MLHRLKQTGFPEVYESNRRLSVACVGKTNTEMETKALNANIKKRNSMPSKCIPIKFLINKKLEVILWGLLLSCCPSWVLWLHFLLQTQVRLVAKCIHWGNSKLFKCDHFYGYVKIPHSDPINILWKDPML